MIINANGWIALKKAVSDAVRPVAKNGAAEAVVFNGTQQDCQTYLAEMQAGWNSEQHKNFLGERYTCTNAVIEAGPNNSFQIKLTLYRSAEAPAYVAQASVAQATVTQSSTVINNNNNNNQTNANASFASTRGTTNASALAARLKSMSKAATNTQYVSTYLSMRQQPQPATTVANPLASTSTSTSGGWNFDVVDTGPFASTQQYVQQPQQQQQQQQQSQRLDDQSFNQSQQRPQQQQTQRMEQSIQSNTNFNQLYINQSQQQQSVQQANTTTTTTATTMLPLRTMQGNRANSPAKYSMDTPVEQMRPTNNDEMLAALVSCIHLNREGNLDAYPMKRQLLLEQMISADRANETNLLETCIPKTIAANAIIMRDGSTSEQDQYYANMRSKYSPTLQRIFGAKVVEFMLRLDATGKTVVGRSLPGGMKPANAQDHKQTAQINAANKLKLFVAAQQDAAAQQQQLEQNLATVFTGAKAQPVGEVLDLSFIINTFMPTPELLQRLRVQNLIDETIFEYYQTIHRNAAAAKQENRPVPQFSDNVSLLTSQSFACTPDANSSNFLDRLDTTSTGDRAIKEIKYRLSHFPVLGALLPQLWFYKHEYYNFLLATAGVLRTADRASVLMNFKDMLTTATTLIIQEILRTIRAGELPVQIRGLRNPNEAYMLWKHLTEIKPSSFARSYPKFDLGGFAESLGFMDADGIKQFEAELEAQWSANEAEIKRELGEAIEYSRTVPANYEYKPELNEDALVLISNRQVVGTKPLRSAPEGYILQPDMGVYANYETGETIGVAPVRYMDHIIAGVPGTFEEFKPLVTVAPTATMRFQTTTNLPLATITLPYQTQQQQHQTVQEVRPATVILPTLPAYSTLPPQQQQQQPQQQQQQEEVVLDSTAADEAFQQVVHEKQQELFENNYVAPAQRRRNEIACSVVIAHDAQVYSETDYIAKMRVLAQSQATRGNLGCFQYREFEQYMDSKSDADLLLLSRDPFSSRVMQDPTIYIVQKKILSDDGKTQRDQMFAVVCDAQTHNEQYWIQNGVTLVSQNKFTALKGLIDCKRDSLEQAIANTPATNLTLDAVLCKGRRLAYQGIPREPIWAHLQAVRNTTTASITSV